MSDHVKLLHTYGSLGNENIEDALEDGFELVQTDTDVFWMADADKTNSSKEAPVAASTYSRNMAYWTKLAPAYDLGFLLRKLQPTDVSFYAPIIQLKMSALRKKNYETNGTDYIEYAFQWRNFQSEMSDFICNSDTPENALCKLAIALFQQHILPQQPTKGSGGA